MMISISREMTMSYFEPPESAFINPQKMKPWAMHQLKRCALPGLRVHRKLFHKVHSKAPCEFPGAPSNV